MELAGCFNSTKIAYTIFAKRSRQIISRHDPFKVR